MNVPLLTGQPAPVIPFTVLQGRKKAPRRRGLTPLEELREKHPRHAALVDDIIAIYLEELPAR